jgi:hypothetical protein
MTIALVQLNPLTILQTWPSGPISINVPGVWQVEGINTGWVSPDGVYGLVAAVPFVVPNGQIIAAGPTYSVVGSQVVENYTTVVAPAPPAPPAPSTFVPASELIGRFTDAEYSAIKAAAITQMQSGVATMQKWFDQMLAQGGLDISTVAATTAATALVKANLLTAARAAIIFAGP